jgi:hypothetical protein
MEGKLHDYYFRNLLLILNKHFFFRFWLKLLFDLIAQDYKITNLILIEKVVLDSLF